MSRLKPLAAAAAATATLALAAPAANANAFSPSIGAGGRLTPGSLPCQILIAQVRVADASRNTAWESLAGNMFVYSGCGGAAI
jgi:hypothetical protein